MSGDQFSFQTTGGWAKSIARHLEDAATPKSPHVHLLDDKENAQLFVVDASQLYDLPPRIAGSFREVLDSQNEDGLKALLKTLEIPSQNTIDDSAPPTIPLRALSLAIAQKCNMGCSYCYAQQGEFGGASKNMTLDIALKSVDLLLRDASSGEKVNLAFLGGEPLLNREVLRSTVEYAHDGARGRNIQIGFSITTNGTLLRPDDADFFEDHAFAVTLSLDGPAEQHDRLRPFKGGKGSFDLIMKRTEALLSRQKQMQVSARVTVTPFNMDLPKTLDLFIDHGFHSVGFSPLLHASNGKDELGESRLNGMLEGMITCGLSFEQHVLRGERYPFLNMVNALRELHRGTHRPYPCGAGAGYLGVSADGELAACHRFVGDKERKFGDLLTGVDSVTQATWLNERHVHKQLPCNTCWARYLCGGGCHHEVLARGRGACDYIRGWLHYTIQAYGRLSRFSPEWFNGHDLPSSTP